MPIESQDDILSSGEVSYTPRLGLPLVPRNNTKALAALNALARLIDGTAANRNGDVLTGDFVFIGTITASGETTLTSLQAGTAVINSGEVTNLIVDVLSGNSGEFTDLVTTNLTSTNATIDTLEARVIECDQLTKYNKTDILDLSTNRTQGISYGFSPDKVEYDFIASGENGFHARGTIFRTGDSSYAVSSGETDDYMGTGMPKRYNAEIYSISLIDAAVVVIVSETYAYPHPISARIIAEK